MAIKQGKLGRRFRRQERKVVSGGTTRLVKPPAVAVAEQSNKPPISANDDGMLRLKADTLRLPSALAEASETGESGQSGMMPGRVVLTITAAAIVFIAVITWFISRMPGK